MRHACVVLLLTIGCAQPRPRAIAVADVDAPAATVAAPDARDYALIRSAKWTAMGQFQLGPAQTRDFALAPAQPSLLIASAEWSGSGDTLEVHVAREGHELAWSRGAVLWAGKGRTVVHARTAAPGPVLLRLKNPTERPLQVAFVVGVARLPPPTARR